MLRAILTSHISQADQDMLSVLINDSLMGKLADDEALNRVVTGNREVHLMADFYSSVDDRSERQYIQEQARLLQLVFSDLQTLGLSALPYVVDKYQPAAASLLIASAELVLIWHDRQRGAYLLRNGRLFRLQPTQRPHDLWAEDWMLYGDFYAFIPQENDLFMFLAPEFVDRFKPDQLEEIFTSQNQMFSVMAKLKELGQTYGYDLDHSWFAFQFQRLEVNRIYKGHVEENLSEEVRRIARSEAFTKSVIPSKVMRVSQGQNLVEPAPSGYRPRPVESQADTEQVEKPQLGDWQRSRQTEQQINVIDEEARQTQMRNWEAYAAKEKPLDTYFEKAREFQIEPLKDKIRGRIWRFFHLWPDQPFFSKFFASCVCVLLVLLLALGFKGLAHRNDHSAPLEVETTPTTQEQVVDNVLAIPPAETNLEKVIIVKVNNLQIRQAQDSSSALMASVKRGESLTQLAPEDGGWIYVRNEEGIEGYVYADYLLPPE